MDENTLTHEQLLNLMLAHQCPQTIDPTTNTYYFLFELHCVEFHVWTEAPVTHQSDDGELTFTYKVIRFQFTD